MARILVCADAPWVHDDVRSVAPQGAEVESIKDGRLVAGAVGANKPDLVVLDMQVGSMGAIASCLELRLEESGGRLPHVPVLILLDRRADVFLVRRAEAEGWLVKPIDPIRLKRAMQAILDGGTFHDDAHRPDPVLVGEAPESATT